MSESGDYNYDPELAPIVDMMPDSDFGDYKTARSGFIEMTAALNAGVDSTGVRVDDLVIPGHDDAPKLPVRVYRPEQQSEATAGLLYIHGGGFVIGNLDTEHGMPLRLVQQLGIVVVSVDYRLAPENPYPAGLHDCYAGLKWLHAEAEALQVDSARIGIMGASAGGGLSAGLALLAKEHGGPSICFQYLGIPELDDRLTTHSMQRFTNTPAWNRPAAVHSWKYYLGEDYQVGADNVPIFAAPGRATPEQLQGLPPAYISTMEFDPLRDEGIEFGLNLLRAGVQVELHSFPGTFHGSSMMGAAEISQRESLEMMAILRRGLGLT